MFTELRLIDDNISRIQNELKSSFVTPDVLLKLADQIEAIHAFIQKMDSPDQGPQFRSEIEKHKSALVDLFGRWQTLFVDAEITQIAEDAQALSEQAKSPQVQKKLRALNEKIQGVCLDECLSLENQLMVTLARRFIAKGLDKLHRIPSTQPVNMTADEIADLTVHLLNIGGDFYNGRIARGLNLFRNLESSHKEGINRYLLLLNGHEKDLISPDFETIKQTSIKMMQAIMAYIKELVQGVFDGSYADDAELELMFSNKGKTDSIK